MKKVLIPLLFITVIVAAFVYINAGGFSEVDVITKTSEKKYIVGKTFEGSVKNDAFSSLFTEIEKLKSDKNYNGYLGAIYYNNPENSKGEIDAFLGVIMRDSVSAPLRYEVRSIPSTLIVEGNVKASNLFGISINKVYKAIFKFADEKELTLEERYVEWFSSKDEFTVQVKIIDK